MDIIFGYVRAIEIRDISQRSVIQEIRIQMFKTAKIIKTAKMVKVLKLFLIQKRKIREGVVNISEVVVMINNILNELEQLQSKELKGWKESGRQIVIDDLKRELLKAVRILLKA